MNKYILIFISSCFYFVANAQLNQSIGNYESISKDGGVYSIKTNNAIVKLSAYSPSIIRVRANKVDEWDDLSYAVIQNVDSKIKFTFTEQASKLIFDTDSIRLVVNKNPLRFQFFDSKNRLLNEDEPSFGVSWLGEEFTNYKKIQPNEKFIGLGEKTGNLNRKGESYTNWNTDNFGYGTNADPIYQSIPFYIGVHSGLQYGIFVDNSHKSIFNFGGSNDRFSSFTTEAGELNYYFITHSSVAKIVESYTFLTGRIQMPPLWSLGFQQCKYSYYPDSEVLSIAKTFREKQIPLDVLYLDIHYMDAYKVFTWNKDRFPNPKRMTTDLKNMGIHTAVIIDPGIKKEKGYKAYEEGVKDSLFLTYPDKSFYTGQVWPGWCHFPDFTNEKTRIWWGNSFKSAYVDNGVEGFWNDMNEPSTWGQNFPNLVEFSFEGKRGTHRKGHNIYGLKMSQSTLEGTQKVMDGKRPFVLTRAGYAGIQRYSAVWTGDNVSSDEHMLLGIRLLNSLGLSGVPVTGMDIGGFTGNPTPQLFARWISIGAFSPFFRAHVGIDQKDQQPWSFGKKVEEISRNYINLRYKLAPYLYSHFYQANVTGMPIQRSLAFDFTHDEKVYDTRFQNQFFCGASILVAPVESSKDYLKVYLPGNSWYDFYNDKFYKGNEEIVTPCPIERLPVFIKGGSIIPVQSLVQSMNEKPSDTLSIHVYYGESGSQMLYYEDDGQTYKFKDGEFYKRTFVFDSKNKKIVFEKAEGKGESKFKFAKIIFHGFSELNRIKPKTEAINFIKPLPHFDPVGTGAEAELVNVKTTVINFTKDRIELAW